MATRPTPPQRPRDYTGELNQLSNSTMQQFTQQSPPAAPAPGNGNANAMQFVMAQRDYEQRVAGLVRDLEKELFQEQQDAASLTKEIEELTGKVEKLEEKVAASDKAITDLKSTHTGEIDKLTKDAETAKGESDKELKAAKDATALLQTEFDALKTKHDDLETANKKLTEDLAAAEKLAQDLGAQLKGLPPAAAPVDAKQGEGKQSEKDSTAQGKTNPPTKVMTAAELRELADGKEGAAGPQNAEQRTVLNEYIELRKNSTKSPDEMRKLMAFQQKPIVGATATLLGKPECAGCLKDSQHHARLIKEAVRNMATLLAEEPVA